MESIDVHLFSLKGQTNAAFDDHLPKHEVQPIFRSVDERSSDHGKRPPTVGKDRFSTRIIMIENILILIRFTQSFLFHCKRQFVG